MKLNDTYLAVMFEKKKELKEFYYNEHCNAEKHKPASVSEDWWQERLNIAKGLTSSPKNLRIYYIVKKVQDEAALVREENIDLHWFSNVANGHYMYVTGKDEFYRFYKTDKRINVLNYFFTIKEGKPYLWYDSYAITLGDGMLQIMPNQDEARIKKFCQLLLYVELGEITIKQVTFGKSIKYGKKGDEKIMNESGLNNVFLVNSNWNTILVIEGGTQVRGHFRVQPYGARNNPLYRMKWIAQYVRKTTVRLGGVITQHKTS